MREDREFNMKVGYARVSTIDQHLELQTDALKKQGCEIIFKEKKSGKDKQRPQLNKMISQLRPNDIVIIWRLDRLGRSLKDLLELVNSFGEKQVGLISLNENINTTTPTGKLVFHIFAALVEFERELIRERTMAGLSAARARGRKGGRPAGLSDGALSKAKAAKYLYDMKEKTVEEIAQDLGIGRSTVYKYLNHLNKSQSHD